jgi:prolyl-tRNA editing enzyme YbaK/EbsC (Cys-tRNA(Pro) deacylase)
MTDLAEVIVRSEIRDLLDRAKVRHELLARPISSALVDDPVRVILRRERAKALVLRADGSQLLGVLPADARIDWKGLRTALGVRRVTIASIQELASRAPGWDPIPPFGELLGLPTLVDPVLEKQERVVFDVGDDGFLRLATRDFLALVKPRVLTITEAAREAA